MHDESFILSSNVIFLIYVFVSYSNLISHNKWYVAKTS